MPNNHQDILDAIRDKREVQVTWPSMDDAGTMQTRRCAPMDYGPGRISRAQEDRYHFWDFESDSGTNHTLSLRSDQIHSVEILASHFDPADFVTWETSWHVPRNTWGNHN